MRNCRRLMWPLLATVALFAAPVAQSQPGPGTPGATYTEPKSAAQVRAYWTKERMARARAMPFRHSHRSLSVDANDHGAPPLGPSGPQRSTRGRTPLPTSRFGPFKQWPRHGAARRARFVPPAARLTPRPARGLQPLHAPAEWYPIWWQGYNWSPLVVKIYYKLPDGSASSCSGAVVAVHLVLTAAHCVYKQGQGWGSQWLVVPGQYGSWMGYGYWAARNATVQPYYQENASFSPYDYAFLALHPNSSGHIGNVVGWATMTFNAANAGLTLGQSGIYSFGYPVEGWFSSYPTYPYSCWAPYWAYAEVQYQGYYEIGMGCTMTGGSSGGPWFTNIGGSWSIISVVSHGASYPCRYPQCDFYYPYYAMNHFGPYFNDDTENLYYYALTL